MDKRSNATQWEELVETREEPGDILKKVRRGKAENEDFQLKTPSAVFMTHQNGFADLWTWTKHDAADATAPTRFTLGCPDKGVKHGRRKEREIEQQTAAQHFHVSEVED